RALGVLIPQVTAHFTTGNRLECQRLHELARAGGHHHLHLCAALDQPPDDIGTFVSRNAAGDTEQDAFATAFHVSNHGFTPAGYPWPAAMCLSMRRAEVFPVQWCYAA